MCEFCGCETARSVKHPLQRGKLKGKALGVQIMAVPMEPKAPHPLTNGSREETRSTPEQSATGNVASVGA